MQHIEQNDGVGRVERRAANVAAREARDAVDSLPCALDVTSMQIDAMVDNSVGGTRQIGRPRLATIARRFDERREKALPAAEVQNPLAASKEPMLDDVRERRIPR